MPTLQSPSRTRKALIADDEYQSRKLIEKMLSLYFPMLITQHEAENIKEAMEVIDSVHPDLIFLDIQMNGEVGFELLDKITGSNFELIFVTAHNEFAVRAFKYNALGYLMKPIDPGDFQSAVATALHKINQGRQTSREQINSFEQQWKAKDKFPDKIIIPATEGYHIVPLNQILYCQSKSNYTEFYLLDKSKLISSHTMGQYEDLLHEHNFFRVHRSFMINLDFIKMYRKGDGGTVVMNDGKEIEVSRSNKEELLKLFRR